MARDLTGRRRRLHQDISELTSGPRRRYPAWLRSRIAAYSRQRVAGGVSLTEVSGEIGVSHPTLQRILAEQAAPIRKVRVASPTTEDAGDDGPSEQVRSVVVRAPGGLTIDGLDLDGVAALVRALA